MPSLPSAGVLAYRRRGGTVEVLLTGPAGLRGEWTIPQWQAAVDSPAAAASIEERLRRPQRARTPTREQLLDVASRGFAAACGGPSLGPIRFLGGVKQHRHRILYVWAAELDRDLGALAHGAALRFFDLLSGREVIAPSQRRFLDELEVLLGGEGQGR